jgi:hypothetical protein
LLLNKELNILSRLLLITTLLYIIKIFNECFTGTAKKIE